MTERLFLQELPLAGLKLIKRLPVTDERGGLQRMYCSELLSQHGVCEPIAQINLTSTPLIGVVRGLHFQYPPAEEIKVVSCLRGRIFDVAVDLRQNSPTFLRWHAVILSAELNNSLLIPKGFAHGYQTLDKECELLYFHTAFYNQQNEGGLCPLDPALGITWPLTITAVSDRDRQHPKLTASFKGLEHEV